MLRRTVFRACGPVSRMSPPPAKVNGPSSLHVAGFVKPVVVTFVRHSESFNNVKHDELKQNDPHNACFELVREADPSLTERGILQAQLVAQRLAHDEAFDDTSMIITSFMHRALKTAEAVQQAFQTETDRFVPVVVDQAFHEIGGHYHAEVVETVMPPRDEVAGEDDPKSPKFRCIGTPGRTIAHVRSEFPSFEFRSDQDCSKGWWFGTTKESVNEGQLRAAAVWNCLQEHASSGDHTQVVVVTHGYLYRVMMHIGRVAGLFVNPPTSGFQLIQNTGITRIQFDNPESIQTALGVDANEWVSDPFVPLLRLRKESLRILTENDGNHVKEIGSLACRNIPVAENPST